MLMPIGETVPRKAKPNFMLLKSQVLIQFYLNKETKYLTLCIITFFKSLLMKLSGPKMVSLCSC
jgi:hypothetical protein